MSYRLARSGIFAVLLGRRGADKVDDGNAAWEDAANACAVAGSARRDWATRTRGMSGWTAAGLAIGIAIGHATMTGRPPGRPARDQETPRWPAGPRWVNRATQGARHRLEDDIIIGGLPAVEGSLWDIGAAADERGAGLAEEEERSAGEASHRDTRGG